MERPLLRTTVDVRRAVPLVLVRHPIHTQLVLAGSVEARRPTHTLLEQVVGRQHLAGAQAEARRQDGLERVERRLRLEQEGMAVVEERHLRQTMVVMVVEHQLGQVRVEVEERHPIPMP